MPHILAFACTLLFVAANFYLWGQKQPALTLLWQSLGMTAVGYPAMLWYVRGSTNRK